MNDGKYFEDYWLEIQRELDMFDSPNPASDFGSSQGPSTNPDSLENDGIIEPNTYEKLTEMQDKNPTNDQMRAKSRADRINAVRDFYNREPTIINANSIYKLHKTADKLYKKGFVKQANELVETAESLRKHFSLVEENDDTYKHLKVHTENGGETILVTVVDKNDQSVEEHEFDDLNEAINFFESN